MLLCKPTPITLQILRYRPTLTTYIKTYFITYMHKSCVNVIAAGVRISRDNL